ncbi:excalibur calcium-binding domain-containing protein [Tateyamaria pelophila]|uniref:excalibur calcium-binding domain-containing protein n=1 Tax=Tateyamaria pelophila TaxID=328415 RepID=UPI001CBDEEA9
MLPAYSLQSDGKTVDEPNIKERVLKLAQSYSCSPRRYCSKSISSCQEARWYFANCSWGGALDGDNDGIPCENLC